MINWEIKHHRFIAFFDILGFKDLVQNNSHELIFSKLNKLKEHVISLENIEEGQLTDDITKDQTKSASFSDSIIFFSKGDSIADASKIIFDSYCLLAIAFDEKIPIKGAISFGEISVDFEKSMFFGQPIIDAYLLHEDLKQLSVILDHRSEVKIRSLKINDNLTKLLVKFKAFLTYGRTTHTLIGKGVYESVDDQIKKLLSLYDDTSGKPRVYLDNTYEFLQFLKNNNE